MYFYTLNFKKLMQFTNSKYNNYVFDGFGAMIMVMALFFSSSIIGLVVYLVVQIFHKDITNSGVFNLISYLFTFLPVIWAYDFFVMRRRGKRLSFNLETRPLHVYLMIFPMMLGMMFIAEFTTSLIPTTGPVFGKWYQIFSEQMASITEDTFTVFLLVGLFAPIIEEIIFRGIIQKGLINRAIAPNKAIIVSAFVFGLVHFNPWQFLGAFLLGIVLGLVYFKTKSLLMSMLLHSFNNTIAAFLMKYEHTENFSELFGVSNSIILLLGILIFSAFYYLFMYKNRVYYKD